MAAGDCPLGGRGLLGVLISGSGRAAGWAYARVRGAGLQQGPHWHAERAVYGPKGFVPENGAAKVWRGVACRAAGQHGFGVNRKFGLRQCEQFLPCMIYCNQL